MATLTAPLPHAGTRWPILALLHPRERAGLLVGALLVGIAIGAGGLVAGRWPLWVGTTIVIALALGPLALKWRDDARRHGATVMIMSIFLIAQGFHGLEHVAQWFEYHILRWAFFQSSGLISAANAEWVHFGWNWIVVGLTILLIRGGVRNVFAWVLLVWATVHALEHAYMLVRYLAVLDELARLGAKAGAQGLPGILGRDGWLATAPATQGTFLCRLPVVTTAIRLDIHFGWNVGETVLLLLAGHRYLGRLGIGWRAADPTS